jgi:hypothetical protein
MHLFRLRQLKIQGIFITDKGQPEIQPPRVSKWAPLFITLTALIAISFPGNGQTQLDPKQMVAEVEKAWQSRDLARVEAVSRKHLAALKNFNSLEAAAMLFYLSEAETIAGKVDDAAEHTDQAFEGLVNLYGEKKLIFYPMVGGALGQFVQELAPRSRANLQAMLLKVREGMAGKEATPAVQKSHKRFSKAFRQWFYQAWLLFA